MNKVILIGRLTKDAEFRQSGETSFSNFTLAVDRHVARNAGENTQTADFISCVAFGKRAEFLEKHGKKGIKFAVEGRIQTGSYTNKEGRKIYTTQVAVENIEFCESKSYSQRQPSEQARNDKEAFMDLPDGIDQELPFI